MARTKTSEQRRTGRGKGPLVPTNVLSSRGPEPNVTSAGKQPRQGATGRKPRRRANGKKSRRGASSKPPPLGSGITDMVIGGSYVNRYKRDYVLSPRDSPSPSDEEDEVIELDDNESCEFPDGSGTVVTVIRNSVPKESSRVVTDGTVKFKVHLINNKTVTGTHYQVLWWAPYGRMPRTWEPRASLVEDGFKKEVELVDEWHRFRKDSKDEEKKNISFQRYLKKYASDYGRQVYRAANNNFCMFNALKSGFSLMGKGNEWDEGIFQQFLKDSQEKFSKDLEKGTYWTVFRAFVKKLTTVGNCSLSRKTLDHNFHKTSLRGIEAIARCDLPDSHFLVAATNANNVGHCFVLEKSGRVYMAFDGDVAQDLDEYGTWIHTISFIRQLAFCS